MKPQPSILSATATRRAWRRVFKRLWLGSIGGLMMFGLSDIPAGASAWSQKPGEGLAILNYRYYQTDKAFTENGALITNDNGGSFEQHEANLYIEYGLPKDLTLIGNFFFQHVTSSDDDATNSNFGFSQQEVGLRWQFSHGIAQAFQFKFGFPGGYSANSEPLLSNNQCDFELLYFIGDSFTLAKRNAFWSLGGGYRLRTGAPADQLRWLATAGYNLSRHFEIFGQLEGIHGLGNGREQKVDNISITTDYTLLKASLNLAYHIDDRWTLSAGPFVHYYGKNTGGGGGVLASLWYRF